MPGERKDPYLALKFKVEIDGITVGGLTDVSGLQVEIEIQDYKDYSKKDMDRLMARVREAMMSQMEESH